MFIQQVAYLVSSIFNAAIFCHRTTERVVALTIDDVPTPNDLEGHYTQLILDTIARHNRQFKNETQLARATFFIIGNHLGNNKAIIAKILAQGHEIGNHGLEDKTHSQLTPEQFQKQLRQTHDHLTQGTKAAIQWYRPGRGYYNKTMLYALENMASYIPKFALASMIPLDTFQLTSHPKFTARYISQLIFPGAILVLHGGNRQRAANTAAALKDILDNLQQKGYRAVTLTELYCKTNLAKLTPG